MSSTSSPRFEENLKLWEVFYPHASVVFKSPNDHGIVKETAVKPSATGVDNLCCTIGEGEIYFHSQGDPEREAADWFAKLDLSGISVLYVYGIGLGYYYDAAKKWLEEDESRSIVFFEDEIEVLRRFLSTERCSRLLRDPQATFFYTRYNDIEVYKEVVLANALKRYKTSGLKTYHKIKSVQQDLIKSTIDFLADMTDRNLAEHFNHGVTFYRNYFLNILELSHNRFGNALFGKFKGIPAIICGAGPSMSDNGKLLPELADRALIFAGGSGMNALNGLGVLPHFGVGVDPNPDQFTRLVMNTAYETPFFFRCRMNHEALDMVHGERLFLTGSSGYNISKWMEEKVGISAEPFSEGHNVLTFSVVIAKLMGIETVVCAGIDLAYSKGQSYSSGIVNHPIHPYTEHFITKRVEEQLVPQKDIYGKEVMSLWKWISESLWYTGFSSANPEMKFFNATEGGIGFEKIENLSLAEVAKKHLTKEYDIAGRVHCEIAMADLPPLCNDKNIYEIVTSLVDSLDECAKICQELEAKLRKKAGDPALSATLDGEIEGLRQSLHEQEGFKALLKGMEDTLSKYQSLQLTMSELRKPGMDEHGRISLHATFEAEMIRHLGLTAYFNTTLIRELLKVPSGVASKERVDSVPLQPAIPIPSPGESYLFGGGAYTLVDPDLGIQFSEKGCVYDCEELHYPTGELKMRTHYKEGRIHGPSRFFDPAGNLLSEAWFIAGKREGKMRTYHRGGAFHSVRGYREGKKSGVHLYFYSDGIARSILPYDNDILSGEVVLFHPGGILARRLTFISGVREGKEQIWDSAGRIFIEAEYAAGLPVGSAKEWYPNGSLAKEVIYDESSHLVEKKIWNAAGTLIKQLPRADFFDKVNVETSNLTAVLGDMVKNMENIVPAVRMHAGVVHPAEESKMEKAGQDVMQEQMKVLKDEMEHLEALGRQLEQWQKEGQKGTKESLWKTPELRERIEGELKKKGQAMNDDLDKIRKGLKEMKNKLDH